MFHITPAMLQAWEKWNKPKASAQDVAFLEAAVGVSLPEDYKEFVSQYGYVLFGRDTERRRLFSYVIEHAGQRETRERGVSFMLDLKKVAANHRVMTTGDGPGDETRPLIPPGYLPIASDAGHGRILLDIAAHPGQVWFWPDSDTRWGTGDNLALGFVAVSFAAFIDGLRPDPL